MKEGENRRKNSKGREEKDEETRKGRGETKCKGTNQAETGEE